MERTRPSFTVEGTLRDRIAGVLGAERSRACVLVGMGHLGSALADYAGFGSRGFEFVGLTVGKTSDTGRNPGSSVTERPATASDSSPSEVSTRSTLVRTPAGSTTTSSPGRTVPAATWPA